MTTNELETYLLRNGFDPLMAPEVAHTLRQRFDLDLGKEPVERLGVANDTVRMDIRTVADDIDCRRRDVAKSRCIPLWHVPFRVFPA